MESPTNARAAGLANHPAKGPAARIAVIYYSATGTVHGLAKAFAEGVQEAGGEVRLRRVPELAPPEAIDRNPDWREHLEATEAVPLATHEDLEWANGYALGTPTRFGNVSSQLRNFLDTTAGLWQRNVFVGRPATCFTASYNVHGGQESTVLSLHNTLCHWGALILPLGLAEDELVERTGGNAYGVSISQQRALAEPDHVPAALDAARYQGARLASLARQLSVDPAALAAVAPNLLRTRRPA